MMQNKVNTNKAPLGKKAGTLAVLLMAASLNAYSPIVSADGKVQSFAIPADSLSSALMTFAAQTGVLISADAKLTKGKTTKGLAGDYSIESGLEKLLANSGLKITQDVNGNYLIKSNKKASSPARNVEYLDELTVTATRAGTSIEESSQRVMIISKEDIERQASLGNDVSSALSNLIPGFSPSRQKMSSYGETFRGRQALYLIDGVPQSNPIRDGSRASHTIDLNMVERIEVIYGASAEHGLGATGGIINFITKSADTMPGELHQSAKITLLTDQEFHGAGSGVKLDYQVSKSTDKLDAFFSTSLKDQGMFYDADGDLVGVSDGQGDVMDTYSYDLFAKLNYQLTDDKSVNISLNRFQLKSHHDYMNVAGDRANGIAATSIKSTPLGEPLMNNVWTFNSGYQDDNFIGGTELDVQAYYQKFAGRFGIGTYGTFQDAAIAPIGTLVDQSENHSEKLGLNITVNKRDLIDDRLDLTFGMDYLQDETEQELIHTGRNWVPKTKFENYAFFLQGSFEITDDLIFNAGVRHENAELNVGDYTTLATYGSQSVEGGNPEFSESLFNAGLTFNITDELQTYLSYSEGFGMPDVGRLLRQINVPGQNVDSLLDLEPIVTANHEIGLRYNANNFDAEVSYFYSTADFGYRLQVVNNVFQAQRQKTEIQGVELAMGWAFTDEQKIRVSFAHTEGKYDSDGDGDVDTKLGGVNVAPDKLSIDYSNQLTRNTQLALMGTYLFDRSFPDSGTADLSFDGYALIDLSVSHKLPTGTLNFAIGNLLNEEYITYYGQSGSTRSNNYIYGRGRNLAISYGLDF